MMMAISWPAIPPTQWAPASRRREWPTIAARRAQPRSASHRFTLYLEDAARMRFRCHEGLAGREVARAPATRAACRISASPSGSKCRIAKMLHGHGAKEPAYQRWPLMAPAHDDITPYRVQNKYHELIDYNSRCKIATTTSRFQNTYFCRDMKRIHIQGLAGHNALLSIYIRIWSLSLYMAECKMGFSLKEALTGGRRWRRR